MPRYPSRIRLAALPSYCIIIRAIHERGESQAEAKAELKRRGLWLSPEQIAQSLS